MVGTHHENGPVYPYLLCILESSIPPFVWFGIHHSEHNGLVSPYLCGIHCSEHNRLISPYLCVIWYSSQ